MIERHSIDSFGAGPALIIINSSADNCGWSRSANSPVRAYATLSVHRHSGAKPSLFYIVSALMVGATEGERTSKTLYALLGGAFNLSLLAHKYAQNYRRSIFTHALCNEQCFDYADCCHFDGACMPFNLCSTNA